FFGRTAIHITPPERHLEIDEPVDMVVAETLLRRRDEADRLALLPDSIQALVLDFDGVFTDNRVIVFQDGREAVMCNRSDGWGLGELRDLGVPIIVISTEINPVVQARCDKLKIPYMQNVAEKRAVLERWLEELNIDAQNVIYVGNDVNDAACMRIVGCPV